MLGHTYYSSFQDFSGTHMVGMKTNNVGICVRVGIYTDLNISKSY